MTSIERLNRLNDVAQHLLWGYLLLVIVVFGPGALSVDGARLRLIR